MPFKQNTHSLCPICLKRIPATYVKRGNVTYFEKNCPHHGAFSVVAWRGEQDIEKWCAAAENTSENPECPEKCGLCEQHLRKTCCAILNVTSRCNLSCNVCFASEMSMPEPSLQQILHSLDDMASKGIKYVHFSGGEPCLRGDIPEIARYAKIIGFEYIQLNTNGLRIAEDADYAKELADAGISVVFLQFDGVTDNVYTALRGRELFKEKCRAIDNCSAARLGIILVPTVVQGVNDTQIGDIIRFGTSHLPSVRGIHFQPLTHVGRTPENAGRFTLPELLGAIDAQTGGSPSANAFLPSCCDHPLCGFYGEFVYDGAELRPIFTKSRAADCCGAPRAAAADEAVRKSQSYVQRRWTRTDKPATGGVSADKTESCCRQAPKPESSIDAFLNYISKSSFAISAMAFQDALNLDLTRLRSCSVHVYENGRLIPFCAKNVRYNEAEGKACD